jgi:NADH:ubiquinone oxidoreductase subunit 4 (subunit M)
MSPLLSLILIPLVTAAFCMAGSAPRRISLFGAGANLLLSLYLLASYNLEIGGFQFVSENALFPAYGLSFSLGADGLSMVMLLLGRLPKTTDTVEWEGWRFEVVDLDGKRVDKVLASLSPTGDHDR